MARPLSPELHLVIGDKRKSSWSLRPWLALRATGYPFRERKILLDRPTSRGELEAASPTGKVPVLLDGELAIWESLAICETLAEWFPGARLWPADPGVRARARSAATEMHGGFADLRRELPMDLTLRTQVTPSASTQADIDRICALWRDCRARFGADGDMLFGTWSIVDCMYAPVATRFRSYGIRLDPVCAAYVDAVLATPDMRAWTEEALLEPRELV
ncbi:glutathione S-transferase family protein [Nannocystis sp. SCPEA4]|uniref:glutathione S-transferase family protein n=1 Tax=Nannocystis sp. SCPEA4 TaxID=2996787 RepID=UPI00227048DC|nr:glutathione S-transferase family protein [Nannocystis sp. SCPEA4]MCY1056387.1 glutathione S-transferase family protein [Nannocystis sp. SCPEA4]